MTCHSKQLVGRRTWQVHNFARIVVSFTFTIHSTSPVFCWSFSFLTDHYSYTAGTIKIIKTIKTIIIIFIGLRGKWKNLSLNIRKPINILLDEIRCRCLTIAARRIRQTLKINVYCIFCAVFVVFTRIFVR